MSIKYRIKKGDEVLVIAGKDKGKKGNIISVDKKNSRVIVEGVVLDERLDAHGSSRLKRRHLGVVVDSVEHQAFALRVPSRARRGRIRKAHQLRRAYKVFKLE